MRLHEYQQKILELDAEIANLTVKRNQLRIEAVTKYYPQYKTGTKVKYDDYGSIKHGIIIMAELDARNPYKIMVSIRPTKKDFTKIDRVVVHATYIRSEGIIEIIK